MEEERQDIPGEGQACAKALWQRVMWQEEEEEGWWGEIKQNEGSNWSSRGCRSSYDQGPQTLWAK